MKLMINLFILFFLTNSIAGQNSKPFVLGVTDEMYSKELNEVRILNIYLPEGYDASDTASYPVIYLLDGSANEDFIHIAGLVQFYSFEWIKAIPKSIVVGIATVDRRRDFTFQTTIEGDQIKFPTAGHSDQFIKFIEKELQPFIQTNYKTNSIRTIIGQSFGGLLATEILFKCPALFNNYILVSPSLWWDNGSLLDKPVPSLEKICIYVGVGKEGLTPTVIPRVMEADANLLAEKIEGQSNAKVYFDYLPEQNHANILHQAVMNAFKHLNK